MKAGCWLFWLPGDKSQALPLITARDRSQAPPPITCAGRQALALRGPAQSIATALCLVLLLAQVNKAFTFIAKHGHKTKVMASNIRSREDVLGLLG